MSTGTDRADIGHAGAGDGAEAVLGAGQHATEQEVRDLGRGHVDHALDQPAVDQLLHGTAARAGGVEDKAVVLGLQGRGHRLHAGVVTPNMVNATAGLSAAAEPCAASCRPARSRRCPAPGARCG